MGPLIEFKNYKTVLVVVDRAVGYCLLIPTTMRATTIATMELLPNYIFTPQGIPTSIVSHTDPAFTYHPWNQTLNTMEIEYKMVAPRHHQTNGQSGRKIREVKTAVMTVITRGHNNWLVPLPQLSLYTNCGYSETIDMSPYKAVYGREYPLLSTY